jgi:large subunit ribosomal protein L21
MFAIIEEAGKQFKVTSGDVINISRDLTEDTVTFNRVLLVGGDGSTKVGTPVVAGATVTADVLGAILTKKTESVKYKRRKGFHKTIGHRQQYTRVKITGITA